MVNFSTIKQSNELFSKNGAANARGLVCVLAGATSNLGAGTLEQLVTLLQESTFYILGRSEARFASQRAKLEGLNPSNRVVFLETEVSLISGIDAACESIAAAETRVDYLFMSQGCIPLTVPRYTKEGIDTCFALSYFSRMRLIVNLLPLLRQSSRPRVLSVLNGGREKPFMEDDIGLEDASHYAPRAAINHTTTMMSLSLDLLAENDRKITFMHSFPGLVATDNFSRLTAPDSYGFLGRLTMLLLSRLISLVQRLFGMSALDCGARKAFLLTNEKYGPGKVWRINDKSDAVGQSGMLEEYKERGWRDKVWDYTLRVFEKALATGS